MSGGVFPINLNFLKGNKFIFKSWSEFFVFQFTQNLSWINLLTG